MVGPLQAGRMDQPRTPKPGDLLLDRYFSDADDETRERAREAFRAHAVLLVRLGERLLNSPGSDSPERDGRRTIQSAPQEPL